MLKESSVPSWDKSTVNFIVMNRSLVEQKLIKRCRRLGVNVDFGFDAEGEVSGVLELAYMMPDLKDFKYRDMSLLQYVTYISHRAADRIASRCMCSEAEYDMEFESGSSFSVVFDEVASETSFGPEEMVLLSPDEVLGEVESLGDICGVNGRNMEYMFLRGLSGFADLEIGEIEKCLRLKAGSISEYVRLRSLLRLDYAVSQVVEIHSLTDWLRYIEPVTRTKNRLLKIMRLIEGGGRCLMS